MADHSICHTRISGVLDSSSVNAVVLHPVLARKSWSELLPWKNANLYKRNTGRAWNGMHASRHQRLWFILGYNETIVVKLTVLWKFETCLFLWCWQEVRGVLRLFPVNYFMRWPRTWHTFSSWTLSLSLSLSLSLFVCGCFRHTHPQLSFIQRF